MAVVRAALSFALVVLAAPLCAQISPGPLSRAHQALDGTIQCAKCHGEHKEMMTSLCLDCHKEIGWLVTRNRGYHFQVRNQPCSTCHPEHAGRDFQLINWPEQSPERFDHALTGWPLDGAHQTTKCDGCHKPAFRRAAAAALSPRRGPEWGWVGLERDCLTCHEDVHRGRLGSDCAKCHSTQSFRTISRATFDHDRTRYPLRGRHAQVKCEKCHDFSAGKAVSNPPFAHCTDCHSDAHAGTATLAKRVVDCDACHSVDGWQPSTYTLAQHELAPYPLRGRHRQVRCEACHVTAPAGVPPTRLGSAGVWLRPIAVECRSCHGDDHGGQLASRPDHGACAACHTVNGWTPSTFTAAEHAPLRLRLEGRHAAIPCQACHGPVRPGLPAPAAQAALGKAGVALVLREVTCAACHVDPHGGRYPKCADCHDVRSFRPTAIDLTAHERFKFPLEGAHRAVSCIGCHASMQHPPARSSLVLALWTSPPVTFAAPPGGCRGCHENPHGTQFATRRDSGACDACHGVETFRPATRFDHERDATFSLKGAHAHVACADCHRATSGAGQRVVIYTPVAGKCEACHDTSARRKT